MPSALQCAPICVGDVNGDLVIDLTDLGILLIDFGCTGAGCVGDVDDNLETDLSDLLALLGHFGAECE